jgi:hypothetical protein
VLTGSASAITTSSATLKATVNPNGGEVSECKFEYGTATSYGASAPCTPAPGSGESPVAVSASITGLAANTTYHFRIVAGNPGGSSKGADQSFTAATVSVYRNTVLAAQGEKLRLVGWGTLTFTNATLGEVECHDITAGYLENPTGGVSGVGQVLAFGPYECVSESCKASGGSGIEVGSETLPWSTEVTESGAGTFRLKIGNPLKASGAMFLRLNCVGKMGGKFVGETQPKVLNNGLSIGAKPGEYEFDRPGAGELASEALGGLKFSGRLKIEGYGAQELIEVRSP